MKGIYKNLDDLATLLKVPSFSDVEEYNTEYIFESGNQAYEAAQEEDLSEDDAQSARERGETESSDELFKQWSAGVLAAADELFGKHKLMVVPVRPKEKIPFDFEVRPVRGSTWEDAAREIVKTIDGVGFVAVSPEDLKPPMKFVASHLHWIRQYPEVYGTPSAERIYGRRW